MGPIHLDYAAHHRLLHKLHASDEEGHCYTRNSYFHFCWYALHTRRYAINGLHALFT